MNSAEQRFYVHPHPFLLMNNAEAIELWKKYADTGGADKNFMVSVCNWLLTFSTTIIGFAFALGVKIHLVPEKLAFSILAILGFVISIASAGIALIYGGYANWNWAKANPSRRALWLQSSQPAH